jgi:antitoxin component YwqK of YwqJK toxin-antitoxin module
MIVCLINGPLLSQNFVVYKGDTVNVIDKNNHKQGRWLVFDQKTKKIDQEGSYLNDIKEGIWTSYYDNGVKKSEITYQNGQKKGYAKIFFENGNTAEEGYWDVDKWTGKYITYYSNGKLSYLWNYDQNGKRHGYQKYFYPNGIIKIEGEWENGKEKGEIKEYYENGSIKSIKTYKDGKLEGETVILPDSNLNVLNNTVSGDTGKIEDLINDTIKIFSGNGYYIFYNKNKDVEKEGYFNNGVLVDGKHNIYDENGNLSKVFIYENGKIISTQTP